MKVCFDDLPNVPDMTCSFEVIQPDTIEGIIGKISCGNLKLPGGKEDYPCRVHPKTFEIEVFVDREWRNIEELVGHFIAS